MAAAHDLLFGLLALQNGLIDPSVLVAAVHAWARDRGRSLADHLVGGGGLAPEHRPLLEGLADALLARHGGDAGESLAALAVGGPTREALARAGGPDVEATLVRVGPDSGTTEPDGDRTATYAVTAAAADGLRFRVLRPHARGGLGAVFVALDAELHREVALKQIRDDYADDPANRARFVREAEITGGLEHPGVVPVYALGAYRDGRPYYAMRFVRGDSLKQAIEHFHAGPRVAGAESAKPRSSRGGADRGLEDSTTATRRRDDPGLRSLALRQLLRQFIDVCNAVEYAHSRGVVHRDIKPGNVIVGRHGETLVVDWGLAKSVADPAAVGPAGERPLVPTPGDGSAETLPGQALGTPAYMSPEQAAGDHGRVGPASDVYSLGATLYCLLTGRPPFGGGAAEVLRAVERGAFRPPRAVAPGVDRALEAVCLKAMALLPADRYPGPRALADDVERWLADEPVTARREPAGARAWRWVRRHRTAATAAAFAVATAAVAFGLSALAVDRQRRLAQENFRDARAAVDEYLTRVGESRLLDVPRLEPLRRELLESALRYYERFAARHAGDPSVRLDLAQALERAVMIQNLIGSKREALRTARRAAALREALVRERPGDARLRTELGVLYNRIGRLQAETDEVAESEASYRRAVGHLEAVRGSAFEDPVKASHLENLAGAYNNLANALKETGRPLEAEPLFRRALELLEPAARAADADPRLVLARGVTLMNRAGVLSDVGSAEPVEPLYQEADRLLTAAAARAPGVPEYARRLASLRGDYGEWLGDRGRLAEAEDQFARGLALLEPLAADHPDVTDYANDLAAFLADRAEVLTEMGRYAAAVPLLERAIPIQERLARDHPRVDTYQLRLGNSHMFLGNVRSDLGEFAAAEPHYREAARRFEGLTERQPRVARYAYLLSIADTDLGNLYDRRGRPDGAELYYGKAIALQERLVGDNPRDPYYRLILGRSWNNLAIARRVAGRPWGGATRRAIAQLEALRELEPGSARAAADLGVALINAGAADMAAGRPAAAHASFARAADLITTLTHLGPSQQYNLACAWAQCARATAATPGHRPADARAEQDRALDALRRAVAAGDPNRYQYATDPDLDPLRPRPDFQLLMMDAFFPADPFAPPH